MSQAHRSIQSFQQLIFTTVGTSAKCPRHIIYVEKDSGLENLLSF